jgi:hypothetical protein
LTEAEALTAHFPARARALASAWEEDPAFGPVARDVLARIAAGRRAPWRRFASWLRKFRWRK